MAAGKITLQANDGKTLSLVAPEGMVANTTDVVATKTEVDTKAPLVSPALTGTPTVNGVAFSGYSGFKNYIINGNFDIWQYGVSQTLSGYGSADRWENNNNFSTKTHSRVMCTDAERVLFNANYFSRTVVTSVANVNNYVTKRTRIEDVTRLAGKTVTLSFWARADSSKNIWVEFKQFFGTGGSPSAIVEGLYGQAVSLTSTWQKKTITLTLPSIIGKTLGTDGVHTSFTEIQYWFDVGSGSLGRIPTGVQQSGTFDIAQVQLEEGSVATPFEQRPYGLELSLCQRYYETAISTWVGVTFSNAGSVHQYSYRVPKRAAPTVTVSYSALTSALEIIGLVYITPTGISVTSIQQDSCSLQTGYPATLAYGYSCRLYCRVNVSAEL